MAVLLPIILFVSIFFPYISLIPGNDGNYEVISAYHWFLGDNRLALLASHPPFKLILFSFFYHFFGYHAVAYIGLIFGIIGIAALYSIGKKLFDEQTALLSSFFLATSGLYLSVGIFGMRDFLVTVFILISFAFSLRSHAILYALFMSVGVLTKEPALFFAFSILLSEMINKKKISITTLMPLIVFAWYLEFVSVSGYHVWNEWNFSSTAEKGSLYTIMNNFVTLQLFNPYTYENWLHLFIFNFNWTYWIAALTSFFYLQTSKLRSKIFPIGLFFLLFTFLVLSFQTFTINRYILPLLPFLYLFAAFGITKMRYKKCFILFFIFISFVSLTRSIDPLSNMIWHKTPILHERFYLNDLDGNDGITYNLQYLTLMKKRTEMIRQGNCNLPPIVDLTKQARIFFQVTCHKTNFPHNLVQ